MASFGRRSLLLRRRHVRPKTHVGSHAACLLPELWAAKAWQLGCMGAAAKCGVRARLGESMSRRPPLPPPLPPLEAAAGHATPPLLPCSSPL